jgi:formylglycine-generating enzyme required for sulfatase activity
MPPRSLSPKLLKIAGYEGGVPRANVVFVHGLGGHPYDTWRTGLDDENFWPIWLATDVPGINVYTLGYHSPAVNWAGTALSIKVQANETTTQLRSFLVTREPGPIVFICHSLGGLIVKQVLTDAWEGRERDSRLAELVNRTQQVIFLATPHQGSKMGDLAQRLWFVTCPSTATKMLGYYGQELRNLNTSYQNLVERRKGALGNSVFSETIRLFNLFTIVDAKSSDPQLPDCEPKELGSDHTSIAKPIDKSDTVYLDVKHIIERLVPSPVEPGPLIKAPELEFKSQWSINQIVLSLRCLLPLVALLAVCVSVYTYFTTKISPTTAFLLHKPHHNLLTFDENGREIAIDLRDPMLRAFKECAKDGRDAEFCGPQLVGLPAGTYVRGTRHLEPDESPEMSVTINYRLAIGRYEISVAEFEKFFIETNYEFKGEKGCSILHGGQAAGPHDPKRDWKNPFPDNAPQSGTHPVVCVNWNDATYYIDWLNRKLGFSGKGAYRLPTEAEWEYAARGISKNWFYWRRQPHFYFGDEEKDLCKYANVGSSTSGIKHELEKKSINCMDSVKLNTALKTTTPVGRYTPNSFGLSDMIGNAREWVQDCHHKGYRGSPTDGSAAFDTHRIKNDTANPDGSKMPSLAACNRVVRGGSWSDTDVKWLYIANRHSWDPTVRRNNVGFRLARRLSH